MPKIIIYTTPFCPYCVSAKRLLAQKGASFEEIDVAATGRRARRWRRRPAAAPPCRRSGSARPTSAAATSCTRWTAPASSTRCWRSDARLSSRTSRSEYPGLSRRSVPVHDAQSGSRDPLMRWLGRVTSAAMTAQASRSCHAAHVGHQRVGDGDGAVGLLVVLQDGDQRAADGEAGAVERVHVLGLAALAADSARPCAAPGSRRTPSTTRSRDRCSAPAATPRCRRSSARQSPCRRCTAAWCDRRARAASALPRRTPSCARARPRSAPAW